MVNHLPTKEHVRNFRQDSWQWDYLHKGRCTTSQTAAALGFLEPKAAEFLGIPRSLQRGGVGAWERLKEDLIGGGPEVDGDGDDGLKEMERILCEGRCTISGDVSDGNTNANKWKPGVKESAKIWIPATSLRRNNPAYNDDNVNSSYPRTKPFPFMAKYKIKVSQEDLCQRKLSMQNHHFQKSSPMRARMQWGNAQEATSILTALNYFGSMDKNTIIHEVGMCGAGFDDANNVESDLLRGLKIGASPDAIICHGNGTVEVLEVKNHCPFVWNNHHQKSSKNTKKQVGPNRNKKDKRGNNQDNDNNQNQKDEQQQNQRPKDYMIRDFELERKIPPMYIPQLMMEMLCVGDAVDLDNSRTTESKSNASSPICTSAVMVRQTATKGAMLLRLYRDEEWIQEMKYWLGIFKSKYVNTSLIPPDNFFWNCNGEDDKVRYRKFLQRTKDLSESVEKVAFVEHGRIQRAMSENGAGGEIPLFLDSVEETMA